jgi:hypothetical protein
MIPALYDAFSICPSLITVYREILMHMLLGKRSNNNKKIPESWHCLVYVSFIGAFYVQSESWQDSIITNDPTTTSYCVQHAQE